MKPKVFISSTYYDLKYIRENLEKMLGQIGFDTVLFESGDVTFEPGKALDLSCYKEISNSNMLVLIVGGRYGSEASLHDNKSFQDEYTSITKKEFLTARKTGIPVYVFIESNVLTEYETFKKNMDNIKKEQSHLNFAFVDSINIFYFIKDIFSLGFPVFRFSKFDDIEKQLKSQISGMLHLYLEGLVQNKKELKIQRSIEDLELLLEQMRSVLQGVSDKVLEDSPETIERIKDEQTRALLLFCVKQVGKRIRLASTKQGSIKESVWRDISKNIIDKLTVDQEYLRVKNLKDYNMRYTEYNIYINMLGDWIRDYLEDLNLDFFDIDIDFKEIDELLNDAKVYLEEKRNIEYLIQELSREIDKRCIPF